MLTTDEVTIQDIARSLSRICRWNRARDRSRLFYSVAEHCVHGHDIILADNPQAFDIARAFLFHDTIEAEYGVDMPYCGDGPHPFLRRAANHYNVAEKYAATKMLHDWGFDSRLFEPDGEVKRYDKLMARAEAFVMLYDSGYHGRNWEGVILRPDITNRIRGWDPPEAERLFLQRWELYE